ncbi:phosphogluconate dehydrogenase (decarboxylating), Cterminal domain containing protein [Acanthamoeba castellanii str. Neff]|uniref:6-phosphogluconate dehydrogenase, decarboxylating n=1 Tax=Acanthamoeba castellanii (strain ATCC 30010 / Neff) TaxID=1257118 RepID=L8HDP8_ACACF|nr:phosphogluconate dehydrogenase (decarboxylating), Cterminal domain containing protein [Acanthamoeba castellanii str. Neff]ELR22893.1 phosphogluconate dehydrogenase (decarboxylating), Cterminal domain containing protein [Acanthamoeba castellanii str. Neff]
MASKERCDVGLVGLGVMGQNLILNMENKGYRVAIHNRTVAKIDEFIKKKGEGKKLAGGHTIEEFCQLLSTPRRIILMVPAGRAVDSMVAQLLPHLQNDDVVIDGGNSFYKDTQRRAEELAKKGIHFVGVGISGGEEGALHGPSIMVGGKKDAWEHLKPVLQSIAAKVDDETGKDTTASGKGVPCCQWMGEDGAGHFVKMVHNGIEYGVMQLICEVYHLMRANGMTHAEMRDVFDKWNGAELDSYLIDISTKVLERKDDEFDPQRDLLDVILDTAEQKGTGRWTAEAAFELGVPTYLISQSVFARILSGYKDLRVKASKILTGPEPSIHVDRALFIEQLRHALYAGIVVSYAEGFSLLRAAEQEHKWGINPATAAVTWRGGCIIRSRLLSNIRAAFEKNPDLENLLLDDFFKGVIDDCQQNWREVVSFSVRWGIPVPGLSASLAYYDALRTERLPANMLQGLRDYFGAHTYERTDQPRGKTFHTEWQQSKPDSHHSKAAHL